DSPSYSVWCLLRGRVRHRGLDAFPTRRSSDLMGGADRGLAEPAAGSPVTDPGPLGCPDRAMLVAVDASDRNITRLIARGLMISRSEEHTSELQSRFDLVCRLLLEKKKYDKPGL